MLDSWAEKVTDRQRAWCAVLIVFSWPAWLTYHGQLTMAAIADITRLLLADNIRHRLVTSGLSVAGLENDLPAHGLGTAAERGTTVDKVRRSMLLLCTELYRKHQSQFDYMLQQLHIAPNTLQMDLETIMADVFYDQVSTVLKYWLRRNVIILSVQLGCVAQTNPTGIFYWYWKLSGIQRARISICPVDFNRTAFTHSVPLSVMF